MIVFGILTALYFFGGGNFSSFSILQIRQSGITGAAPIWNKIISYLTTSQNRIVLENLKPAGIISLNVCPGSNTLACGGCAQAEYYISGTEPTKHCAPPKPPEEEKEEDEDEE